VFYPN